MSKETVQFTELVREAHARGRRRHGKAFLWRWCMRCGVRTQHKLEADEGREKVVCRWCNRENDE